MKYTKAYVIVTTINDTSSFITFFWYTTNNTCENGFAHHCSMTKKGGWATSGATPVDSGTFQWDMEKKILGHTNKKIPDICPIKFWLVVWLPFSILFPEILGISSSQLTLTHIFAEAKNPASSNGWSNGTCHIGYPDFLLVGGEWLPWILNVPMNIGLVSSSQLTNSYFSGRGGEKPPSSLGIPQVPIELPGLALATNSPPLVGL